MEALRKEEIYTIDDIYALPEGEHAELIEPGAEFMLFGANFLPKMPNC